MIMGSSRVKMASKVLLANHSNMEEEVWLSAEVPQMYWQ